MEQPDTARSTATRDGETILDLGGYTPFLLSVVAAAWQRTTSAKYRRTFGLGITDWRVISMLNIEPEITASRVCHVIHMDKAAVSRSLRALEEGGYVTFDAPPDSPRNKLWRLTDAGRAMHDMIMVIALDQEKQMLKGVSEEEITVLLATLRKLHANLSD